MNDYEKDFYKIMRTMKSFTYSSSGHHYYDRLNIIRNMIKSYEKLYGGEDFELCCKVLWYNYWAKAGV